jgi:hypothetical protein
MPKERFTDGEFSFEVSWHPETEDIQVSVNHDRARYALLERRAPDADGKPVAEMEQIKLLGGGFAYHLAGWHEINRTIQVFKRARDHIWTPA